MINEKKTDRKYYECTTSGKTDTTSGQTYTTGGQTSTASDLILVYFAAPCLEMPEAATGGFL